MKTPTWIFSLLLICGLAILAMCFSIANAEGGILITNADSTRTDFPAASSTLNNVLDTVPPHFQIQFSESLRNTFLANVPPALQNLLNSTGDHIQIQFAQSNRTLTALAYPAEIIDDTTAPQITDLNAIPTGDGSTATITWTTLEFSDSTVLYGTQAGNLTESVSDVLFNKNHSLPLTGLTPGILYYFKVQSTDLEGNLAESAEDSFVAVTTQYVYLPIITR